LAPKIYLDHAQPFPTVFSCQAISLSSIAIHAANFNAKRPSSWKYWGILIDVQIEEKPLLLNFVYCVPIRSA